MPFNIKNTNVHATEVCAYVCPFVLRFGKIKTKKTINESFFSRFGYHKTKNKKNKQSVILKICNSSKSLSKLIC